MTPAQIRKRHEIAEAIHRDHPDMPMERKMKMATAAAMGRTRHRRRPARGGY